MRFGGVWGAQHDQILRRGNRLLDLLAEVVGSRELVLVPKDRRQSLRDDAIFGQRACKARRDPIFLELAVQPVGKLLVAMAVAKEGVIAGLAFALASRPKDAPPGHAILGRQSGMLGHAPPPGVSV